MNFWALLNQKTGNIDLISTESQEAVPEGFYNHEWIRVKRGTALFGQPGRYFEVH